MAGETEWGLYEAIPELRAELPGLSDEEIEARARVALRAIWQRGLVDVYLESSRPPRDAAEERQIRDELARRPAGDDPSHAVSVPVHTPLSPTEIEAVLVSTTAWRPPESIGDRPWFETPHPYFIVTAAGQAALRAERTATDL